MEIIIPTVGFFLSFCFGKGTDVIRRCVRSSNGCHKASSTETGMEIDCSRKNKDGPRKPHGPGGPTLASDHMRTECSERGNLQNTACLAEARSIVRASGLYSNLFTTRITWRSYFVSSQYLPTPFCGGKSGKLLQYLSLIITFLVCLSKLLAGNGGNYFDGKMEVCSQLRSAF